MTEYYISNVKDGKLLNFEKVQGKKVSIVPYLATFIYKIPDDKYPDRYIVTEATSGAQISSGYRHNLAIQKAKKNCERAGKEKILKTVKSYIDLYGRAPYKSGKKSFNF